VIVKKHFDNIQNHFMSC